ncbi:uncharacterized protein LOC129765803 [Toxorhynchites rutilus septentrionalis]|uniref:uncharacterized protein LOC129765803 n=1 Tax=Toxorhynchites rutilus septentrionalis TaxID=329112 RepID=UPI00247A5278|nr:uncharacterized protein LOC129765803 [Toxorhynchites rutilus septentrionalis]
MSHFIYLDLQKRKLVETISIQEQINIYRSKTYKKPLIIIDLMYFDQLGGYLHNSSTKTKMRDLCGISSQRVEELKDFLADLSSWGANLTFITNGPFHDVSGHIFQDPNYQKEYTKECRYRLQCGIIDRLGKEHYSEVASNAKLIPIEPIWTDPITRIARMYGTILRAWDNTRHQEVIRYASEHEAFAIITKNFSLLLYAGSVMPKYRLWSMANSNKIGMTIAQIEPLAVRRTLRLSVKQLRLLGVFCDWYYTTPTFSGFLERAKIENSKIGLFKNLIDYVKRSVGNLQDDDYLRIAHDLYGEDKFIDSCHQLKSVCESYNIDNIKLSTEQNNDIISMKLKGQDSFNYDIYHDICFSCSITFIDYRYWLEQGVNFYDIVMSIYQRISGLILQHRNDSSLRRYIMIKRNHDEPFATTELKPEYPKNFEVLSLDDLFSFKEETLGLNIRFLEFITGLKFDETSVNFFHSTENRNDLHDTVTLLFMVTSKIIIPFEADIFLLAIQECRKESSEPNHLPENLNLRAFHLYFMYLKMRVLIKHCFYGAGFDETFMDECKLDGTVFQTMFQKWIARGATDDFSEAINRLGTYRMHGSCPPR